MRFRREPDNGFWPTLRAAVDAEVRSPGRSPFAPPSLWAKAAFYLTIAGAGYAALVVGQSFAGTMAAYAAFNLAALLLVLNLAHDAAHDALTPNRAFNQAVTEALFGLIGIDGYLWRMRHTRSHHVFPNINGCDADIDHNPLLRLSPNHPWCPRHRWQHLYAVLVYMTVHLHAVLVQDTIYILQKSLANLRNIRHTPQRYAGFVAMKLTYAGVVLGVPIACSSLPWAHVLGAYVLATVITSLFFVMVLIGTHFAHGNAFPQPDAEGRIGSSFVEHVFSPPRSTGHRPAGLRSS